MAAVCLVWNTLVAMFVVQVIQQHVDGPAELAAHLADGAVRAGRRVDARRACAANVC